MKSVDKLRKFIRDNNILEGSPLWDELDDLTSDIEYDVEDLEGELEKSKSEIEDLENRLEELE